MGCVVSKMEHMNTITQPINSDRFMSAVASDYADTWDTNPRYWNNDDGWMRVTTVIDTDHDGELAEYVGADLTFDIRHTVLADEPQCYEGYPEVRGVVTYDGHTYKFHLDTYTGDSTWEQNK